MVFFTFGVDISIVFAVKLTPFGAQKTRKKNKIKQLTDVAKSNSWNILIYFPVKGEKGSLV